LNKIYSIKKPGRLLHVVLDTNEPFENRLDLCDVAQWLQISVLKPPVESPLSPTPRPAPARRPGHHPGMLDRFARRDQNTPL
jgi:hypothetical protein